MTAERHLPLDDRIRTASELLKRARIFFDVWWLYEGQATRSGILDAMNEYPDYFTFDSHAHFVAHIVHMAMLYEGGGDTTNLRALRKELGARLDAKAVASLDQLFAKAHQTEKKVRILRNNVFAHRSARITYDDVFKMAKLTPGQLRELTEASRDTVNIFLETIGQANLEFHPYPEKQLVRMLKDIDHMRIQNEGIEIRKTAMPDQGLCPLWGTQAQLEGKIGDFIIADSPRAGGRFSITGSAETTAKNLSPPERAIVTFWMVKQHSLGVECPSIDSYNIEAIRMYPKPQSLNARNSYCATSKGEANCLGRCLNYTCKIIGRLRIRYSRPKYSPGPVHWCRLKSRR
ncbi:hypothetical protein G5V57_16705 [Nordella sp. HKS 07]|uniref:AbiU2 domain-containing protein n=1 Tax=Nordella sp. HKS 07 TaxID=2712222 RepID=UPI0013E1EAC1|nr:hypothetical protein [Nordella sp. HKS 07]QIG49213.1 hypothetical protein G5V57_16705 [Nordella sp. HKS 07]